MAYTHLSYKERHYVELELKKGTLQKDITASLGRSPSTLSRELSRNIGKRGTATIKPIRWRLNGIEISQSDKNDR